MTRYEEVRALVKDDALRIKDIALQTGYDKGHVSRLRKESRLEKVIADAVAAEREACAKVCEETTASWTQDLYNSGCMDCAAAIRARSAT